MGVLLTFGQLRTRTVEASRIRAKRAKSVLLGERAADVEPRHACHSTVSGVGRVDIGRARTEGKKGISLTR
jgi:hypothetical protein